MSSTTEFSKGKEKGLVKGGPRPWRTASIPPTHARVQIAGITAGRLIAGITSNGAAAHGQGLTLLRTNRVSRLFEERALRVTSKNSLMQATLTSESHYHIPTASANVLFPACLDLVKRAGRMRFSYRVTK